MTLLGLTHFTLLLVGLVYLLCMSLIFAPARKGLVRLSQLTLVVYCPTCSSFWIGLALCAAGLGPFAHPTWYEYIESGVIAVGITTVWVQVLYHGVNHAYIAEQGVPDAPQTQETTDG